MFGSEILEVAVGLVFIYLIFSLLSSSLKEIISRVVSLRAKTLEEGIVDLVGGRDIGERLYRHPLLQGVSQSGICRKLTNFFTSKTKMYRPDYIPSYHFFLAFIDTVSGKDGAQMKVEELEAMIDKIAVPQVKKTLNGFLNSIKAETNQEEEVSRAFRKAVEYWFDNKMEQLTQWYKRKSRLIICCLTLVIVAVLNVDTLMIARNLYKYDMLRETVVAAAKERAGKEFVNTSDTPITMLSQVNAELENTGLPIGWNLSDQADMFHQGLPRGFWQWLYKFFGLFMTVLAVAMGAPFWFDMLRKLTSLFSQPPRPSREPKSSGGLP